MTTRILIINDEPRWIEFARQDLGKFEIVVATTIGKTLAVLKTNQSSLAITSSRRLDILSAIPRRYTDKRVVATTIQPTTQEALSAYRLGAVRYCTKSFGPTDLLSCVTDLVSTSNSKPLPIRGSNKTCASSV